MILTMSSLNHASSVTCMRDGKGYSVDSKTITIVNNTPGTIYPVITIGKKPKEAPDEWLKACFPEEPAPIADNVYKLYIRKNDGLKTKESVTITLPLYSNINNVGGADRYISWWNGGRVIIADNKRGLEPTEEEDKYEIGITTAVGLECTEDCKLYRASADFPADVAAQLSEYTFGGVPGNILNTDNVGYNISYVDHVYLPVAIGPKGNKYIGYSGSVQKLDDFRDVLKKFLAEGNLGEGWPVYNIPMPFLRLPGAYNIFAQRTGVLDKELTNPPIVLANGKAPVLTSYKCLDGTLECTEEEKQAVLKGDAPAIAEMIKLWSECDPSFSSLPTEEGIENKAIKKSVCTSSHQSTFGELHGLFKRNFDKQNCGSQVDFDQKQFLMHIYGWVPFNEGCANAKSNALGEDSNFQDLLNKYIELQYSEPGNFNPYVKLIHDKEYLNMDAYAFSVDDDVGFMSELGTGLIFTVGGAEGLENTEQFTYKPKEPGGFAMTIGNPFKDGEKKTQVLKSYGACSQNAEKCVPDVDMPKDSVLFGFRLGTLKYPAKVVFTDVDNYTYSFVVKKDGWEKCLKARDVKSVIDGETTISCGGSNIVGNCQVTDANNNPIAKAKRHWCAGLDSHIKVKGANSRSYVSTPKPWKWLDKDYPN